MEPTPAEWSRGRRRLRDLLPWARAEVRNNPGVWTAQTALGKTAQAYVTEENLDAILIYPAPLGGWHCDVVFKTVPLGVPNSMGTPVAEPVATRADAERRAKDLLVGMLVMAALPKPADAPPMFLLNGCEFELSARILEMAVRLMPQYEKGYGSPLQAYGRVEAILDKLCPDGFNAKAYNDEWPRDKQIELLIVLHIATLSGLFAYPMRRDAPPPSQEASS